MPKATTPSSRGASAMPHWTPSLPPGTRARPPVGILPLIPGRPQFGTAAVAPLSWVLMEGRQPNRLGESLTRRQKRVFAAVGAALVVVLGGVGVWAATDPGSYGRSGNGCVNVTVPSTTGGGILHECGDAAQALCERAFAHHDRIALLARPQCRLAGYAPAAG